MKLERVWGGGGGGEEKDSWIKEDRNRRERRSRR